MAGYREPLITLRFPELSEPDDPIYVVIRNPRLMPLEVLIPGVATDEDGNALDARELRRDGYRRMAELIVNWHVYDPFSVEDVPGPMAVPATAEAVEKLPARIQMRIGEEMAKATDPTETPTIPTSSPA